VINGSTAKADALATAMMVMGETEALSLAEKYDIPAYLLVKQGDGFVVKHSTAFSRYLSGE
jgi:thiamine biosynthesis lipoprotein